MTFRSFGAKSYEIYQKWRKKICLSLWYIINYEDRHLKNSILFSLLGVLGCWGGLPISSQIQWKTPIYFYIEVNVIQNLLLWFWEYITKHFYVCMLNRLGIKKVTLICIWNTHYNESITLFCIMAFISHNSTSGLRLIKLKDKILINYI